MNAQDAAKFVVELDVLIAIGNDIKKRFGFNELLREQLSAPAEEVVAFNTRCKAAINRTTQASSTYRQDAESFDLAFRERARLLGVQLLGLITGLRADLSAGYLTTATEAIHADTFADFLERAQYLLDEGHKDAAAVVAGSTLEAHLRNLCVKFSVPLEVSTAKGLAPKKAEVMNADLCKANAYNTGVQKGVTAWLDTRNQAAHGHYDKYSAEQVKLLIMGVRDFINANPA